MPKTVEAPGAETASPRPVPARKKRYHHFPDGKDYVLMGVQRDQAGNPVPNGALIALPEVPRFESAQEAERWLKASGAQFAGYKVICQRVMWAADVAVEQKPAIAVTMAPKHEKPTAANAVSDGPADEE